MEDTRKISYQSSVRARGSNIFTWSSICFITLKKIGRETSKLFILKLPKASYIINTSKLYLNNISTTRSYHMT